MPKKSPANSFRYLIALGFGGLSAKQPRVHGKVATRYEILLLSIYGHIAVSSVPVHKYVVPVMVVSRGDISPAAASNGSEKADSKYKFG